VVELEVRVDAVEAGVLSGVEARVLSGVDAGVEAVGVAMDELLNDGNVLLELPDPQPAAPTPTVTKARRAIRVIAERGSRCCPRRVARSAVVEMILCSASGMPDRASPGHGPHSRQLAAGKPSPSC
jgi:hypothetical protein